MAGARTQKNKPHKTRFASKASRHAHKLSADVKRIHKGAQQVLKGGKAARIQQSKMIRDHKRAAVLNEKRSMNSSTAPPRVILLFPLSSNVELSRVRRGLLSGLASDGENKMNDMESMPVDEEFVDTKTICNVQTSTDYKLRLSIMEACRDDFPSCLEMAKVADVIAFVASADNFKEGCLADQYIDSVGKQCLSMFRALGLPSTIGLITGLPSDLKKHQTAKKSCTSSLAAEFPEDCKFFPADSIDDFQKLLRHLSEKRISVPQWKSQRPFILADKIDISSIDQETGKCTVLLSGYVRAHALSVNQLVYVPRVGDYQLSQIDILEDPFPLRERKRQNSDQMQIEQDSGNEKVIQTLFPTSDRESITVENIPDPLAGEQTWPTEEEMAKTERQLKQKRMKKKKLPPGTSDYQAAWIVDSDEDIDTDDDDDDTSDVMGMDKSDDESDHYRNDEMEDDLASLPFTVDDKATHTEFMDEDDKTVTHEQMQEEIKRLKEAHAEDKEYPDEVDAPLNVPARQRFAKYRGLKSFRTSKWDPKESLPADYARIFQFDNYSRTYKHVLAKAKENNDKNKELCASVGSYIQLHIKGISLDAATMLVKTHNCYPVLACGLLQHETKLSVLNFSIKKCDFYEDPIKSKEPLIFHVGFRQFNARPIFSSDDINMDNHKLERFLHAGNYCVATVFAPISFPPLPLIAFKDSSSGEKLAAYGLLRSVDPDRIVLKRIILTGYPQRVSKVKALVRFMFHHPEDVRWFKPVELWTKYGRRGAIKEPVGTHGSMKCKFEGVLQQRDTVCMSLYKRVYPKWPEQCS